MRRTRGFTLIELLVVVAIIGVLVSILLPVIADARESARIANCTSNMKNTGSAIFGFKDENKGLLPALLDYGNPNAAPAADASKDDITTLVDPCGMQNAWLLMERGLIVDSGFRCPSDSDATTRDKDALKYGWEALTEFSYGIHWPYADVDDDDTVVNECWYNGVDSSTGDDMYNEAQIIMADRNPLDLGDGVAASVDGSSVMHSNHKKGLSRLYKGGSATFYEQSSSSRAGTGDDIYLGGAAKTAGTMPDTDTNREDCSITPAPSRT